MIYNEKDKTILDIVTDRFKVLDKKRVEFDAMWLRYYKIYRSIIAEEYKKDVGANIFVPYVFNIVETVKPRIVTTMLAARPYIGLVSLEDSKADNAEVMTNFMDYQMNHKMCFTQITSNAVISALIYGTGITKQTWRMIERNKKRRIPSVSAEGVKVGYEIVTENKKVYDDPYIENIDIFDFYVDPFIESIDDQPDCIHRYICSRSEMKKILRKLDKPDSMLADIMEGSSETNTPTGVVRRMTENNISSEGEKSDSVEILEYYTDDDWIIIANRSVVINAEENPYWHGKKPFAKLVDINVPGEFYGIGEIEPVEYLQHELNTMRNQRVDNVNVSINKMFSILRGSDIDTEQLITRPGGFIEVDSHDDIKEIEFKDVTQNAYQEDTMVKDDIDKTSGVFDYTRGASGARRETATTATILSDASNERFKLKVLMFESTWLVELGRQISELNQQFIDTDRVVANVNGDVTMDVEVSPENLDGEFEFMAIGSSVEPVYNKAARQQVMMTLFQTLAPMPFINAKVLAKNLLKAYDVREIDRIIIPDDKMPKVDGQGNSIDAIGNVTKTAQQQQAEMQAAQQQQQMMAQQQQAQQMPMQGENNQMSISPEQAKAAIEAMPPEDLDNIISELESGQVPKDVPIEIIKEIVNQLQGGMMNGNEQ